MAINWIKIYDEYRGKWIALEKDEKTVVASGKTAKSAYNKAVKIGLSKPILSYISNQTISMVG